VASCPGEELAAWLGLRVDDQVSVAHGLVPEGELEHAVEDHLSAADPRRLKRNANSLR